MKRFFVILADEYKSEISISGVYEAKEEATAQMRKIFNGVIDDVGHGEMEKITSTGFFYWTEGTSFLCSIKRNGVFV